MKISAERKFMRLQFFFFFFFFFKKKKKKQKQKKKQTKKLAVSGTFFQLSAHISTHRQNKPILWVFLFLIRTQGIIWYTCSFDPLIFFVKRLFSFVAVLFSLFVCFESFNFNISVCPIYLKEKKVGKFSGTDSIQSQISSI